MMVLVGLLVLAGLILIWRGRQVRAQTGLPWRQVVYQDTNERTLSRPLVAARHGLTGQPDYILQAGDTWIPVEVKPTRRDQAPRQSDIVQVAAYCLLIEETTGVAPPHGLLRYQSATFEIPWDDELYGQLMDVLEAIRSDRDADDVPRSHAERRRCRACGFADRCEDSLWTS